MNYLGRWWKGRLIGSSASRCWINKNAVCCFKLQRSNHLISISRTSWHLLGGGEEEEDVGGRTTVGNVEKMCKILLNFHDETQFKFLREESTKMHNEVLFQNDTSELERRIFAREWTVTFERHIPIDNIFILSPFIFKFFWYKEMVHSNYSTMPSTLSSVLPIYRVWVFL